METMMNEKSAKTREWKRPQFTKLGGLAQVANVCNPSHVPICSPS